MSPAPIQVDTSQIHVGDLVLNYGMRIRIDEIKVIEDETSHGGYVYCCLGTVLNVQEAIETYDIPRSFMFDNARFAHGRPPRPTRHPRQAKTSGPASSCSLRPPATRRTPSPRTCKLVWTWDGSTSTLRADGAEPGTTPAPTG